MTPSDIARRHFAAAMEEARAKDQDLDAVARQFLALVTRTFCQHRSVGDARAELLAAADHCDPDEEFAFMRP